MKRTLSRTLAVLLMLLMVVGMLPMATFAATGNSVNVWVGGVQMKEGYHLKNNATALTNSAPGASDDGYAYMKDATTLVLKNYSYEGEGHKVINGSNTRYYCIYSTLSSALTIELQGTNTLKNTGDDFSYGITTSKKLVITGNGSLSARGDRTGILTEDDIDIQNSTVTAYGSVYGLFAKSLNIKDSTVTATAALYDGIATNTAFTITNSSVTADGGEKAFTNKPDLSGFTTWYEVKAGDRSTNASKVSIISDYHRKKHVKITNDSGRVANPTTSPDIRHFGYSRDVTFSCATPGATIKYTTDGTHPATSTTAKTYSSVIKITDTTTFQVIATKDGMTNSEVMTEIFTKNEKVATPTISPDGGSFTGSQSVTLSCSTSGATIKYTTDGTSPIYNTNAKTYSSPFTISDTVTVKAVATYSGMTDSDVATASFTKTADPPGTSVNVWVSGVQMKVGYHLKNNATALTTSAPGASDDGYAYLASDGKTLTLKNYRNGGKHGYYKINNTQVAYIIVSEIDDLTIVLEGSSVLSDAMNNTGLTSGIHAKNLTVKSTTNGSLKYIPNHSDAPRNVSGINSANSSLTLSGVNIEFTGVRQGIYSGNLNISDSTVKIDSRASEYSIETLTAPTFKDSDIKLLADMRVYDYCYAINMKPNLSYTNGCIVKKGTSRTSLSTVTDLTGNYYSNAICLTFEDAATASATLTGISVSTPPTKTVYTAGESFDPTGMVVTAAYSDSTSAPVTGYTVTDGNNLTAGKTTVNISYTEDGVNKTTTQAITVNAATPDLVNVWVGGVQMKIGNYLPSSPDGTLKTLQSTAPATGGYAYMEDEATLVLSNYSYKGEGYERFDGDLIYRHAIYSVPSITIKLEGTNSLENAQEDDFNYGVYVDNNLDIIGGGTLNVTSDDGISCDNLTIEDSTITAVVEVDDGLNCDNLTIKNSTVTLTVGDEGLNCGGSITITDSTVNITAGDDGIDCEDLEVTNSTLNVNTSNIDGIDCYDIIITNSNVTATGTDNGIECNSIAITDSTVIASTSSTEGGVAIDKKPNLSGFTTDVLVEAGDNAIVAAPVTDLDSNYNEEKFVMISPKITFTVTVNGSNAATTGAGDYIVGETVNIHAGTRSGYTFSGWTTSDGVTFADKNKVDTSFVMPNRNVTVTANWKKNSSQTEPEVTYTLSFVTNGGSAIPAETYTEGTEVNPYSYTTKLDGYTFNGWYSDSSLTKRIESTIKMTGNVTIYAGWTKKQTDVPDVPVQPSIKTKRLAGGDRIDTAIAISRESYDKADNVVLANGFSYPDALAGTSYAAAINAPVLLTGANTLDARTLAEIERLNAKRVTILGGKAAISEAVEKALQNKGIAVTRLAGDDRFGTAIAVAKELAKNTDGSFDTIYLASGVNYPDALSISPVAAIEGNPVLYLPANGVLDKATADYLKSLGCKKAVILGGVAAVGAEAENNLAALGMTTERIYGADRYATSLAIAERYNALFTGKDMSIATGKNFPDALAGAAFAAQRKMPVVLVGNSVPGDLADYTASRKPENLFVFGGSNAVSDSVVGKLVG